jgi:hypothetical protein
MNDDRVIDLLQTEYFQLQKIVEDFDSRALTIKAWSVTLSAAAMITAYVQATPIILAIAAVSALVFWLIEGLWKLNQQAFYARIYEIENSMANGQMNLPPLQIASSWSKNFNANRRERKIFDVLQWPHVYLPHMPIAVAAFALLLFFRPAS